MNERLLQFIWQFQYYSTGELDTTCGEGVHVYFPGYYNNNQGPDFINARVRIGTAIWVGTVELHMKTSDWEKHRHTTDSNYDNVILHVVWKHDLPVNNIPVLELSARVPGVLLQRYEELLYATSFIACEKSIHAIQELTLKSWKDRLLVERLLRKTGQIETFLKQNNYHWEETCWWLLARNFGLKVNAELFEAMARSIPLTLLIKIQPQLLQLEALLLGQAGLLRNSFIEDYPVRLKKEYAFLRKKYGLQPVHFPVHFLRMRPGNFPTIRLAQLAKLFHVTRQFFVAAKEADSAEEVRDKLNITASEYWNDHYRFEETSAIKEKRLGAAMINNVMVNTIIPLVFAYGNYYNDDAIRSKALKWLEETIPEQNVLTRGFEERGLDNRNAYDSQALIELKTQYCDHKKCLDCAVGNALLGKQ